MFATLQALAPLAAVNPGGASNWVQNNIIPLIFLALGVIILAGAKRQQWGQLASIIGVICVGLSFVVAPQAWIAVAGAITNAVLGT